ncbi:MAG: prephenate dehydratase domain-containing protein [Sphingomonadales bacterium]
MEQQTEDLLNIRENVEALDQQLLEMIATRRRLSEKIAVTKRSNGSDIRNFSIEQTRLGQLIEKGRDLGIDPFSVSKFYQNIIEDSVLTQHAHLHHLENIGILPKEPRVAFLGGEGAYSQFATRKYFSFLKQPVKEIGLASFNDVVTALDKGQADYAVLPYINSTTGLIEEACEALLAIDGPVVGEIYLPIEHCLLGQNWDYPVSSIRTIYAHPQVFAQCKGYLRSLNNINLVPVESTFHALQKVADGRVNEAAIGSAVAGNIFGLKALKSNLQGERQNFTRFLVLGKTPHKVPVSVEAKTTLALVPNGNELAEILLEFQDRDIPVAPRESKPGGDGIWERVYLLDITARTDDKKVLAAFEVLKEKTGFLKILGCYPSGRITSFFGA